MIFMKSVIPFTKELEFATKVSEITSISLEREFAIINDNIEGNLLITGEYKSHEVSVNVIPFSFKVPFTIAISSKTIIDSISLEISDFAYDTVDDNKIKVHIELELSLEEEVSDNFEELPSLLENSDDRSLDDINNLVEEVKEDAMITSPEEVTDEPIKEESSKPNLEETVLKTETEDEYMTYHIHILKEGETLETICTTYSVTGSFLAEYNDLSNLNPGDKILIPVEK